MSRNLVNGKKTLAVLSQATANRRRAKELWFFRQKIHRCALAMSIDRGVTLAAVKADSFEGELLRLEVTRRLRGKIDVQGGALRELVEEALVR